MKATTRRSQSVLQSPQALLALRRGFEQLAAPLATTLGPSQRMVMNEVSRQQIELLADAGTIAARFVDLKARGENVGAMLLRTMVMQLHATSGDGAATATVLARALLREGSRLLAAGCNPTLLRRGIARGVQVASLALQKQAVPIDGQEMYTALANSMTSDPALGNLLGEMLDILGDSGGFIVNESDSGRLEHEYLSGGRWAAIPGDRLLIPEGMGGLELLQPLVMVVNEDLSSLEQVQSALELAATLPTKRPLLIIARDVKDMARNALVLNHVRGVLNVGIALLKTGSALMHEDMHDIAILTGAQLLSAETGYSPANMRLEYFGRSRKATITGNTLTIVDGDGEAGAVRGRVAEIRARMRHIKSRGDEWHALRLRAARLSGGVGAIMVGGFTEQERAQKKEMTLKVLRAIEDVQVEGVVPGGGVAYLACIEAVQAASLACSSVDEAAGIALVATALTAPFSQIVHNYGGLYPPLAIAEALRLGPSYGFDALRGDFADMFERGILDSVKIARTALEAAASLATMAITTDTIVMM